MPREIVRILKGKPFRKPDISATIQEVLKRLKIKEINEFVVDVGVNVGMTNFACDHEIMGCDILDSFRDFVEYL